MLSTTLAASILAFLSIAAAYFARPTAKEFAGFERIFIVWAGVSALGFWIPSDPASLTLMAVFLFAAAPKGPANRIALYMATFIAIPIEHAFNVPFPGINYLVEIDYGKLSALILLGPCVVTAFSRPSRHLRVIDALVVLFYIMTSALAARELPFTSVIRQFFDSFVLMILPYFVISRSLRTREDFDHVFRALFLSILILAMVGFFSSIRAWNFYELMHPDITQFADFRGGFLRIAGPLMPILLGLLMALGVIGTLEFGRRKLIDRMRWFAYLALFGAMLLLSGSRGAWLAGAVSIVTYIVYARAGGLARRAYFAAGLIALASIPTGLLNFDLERVDPYGTFRYRAELLQASMREVMVHPFFGSAEYAQSKNFEHLVTGWGIIDFVNSYLQIALQYGFVGLFNFIGIAALLVLALMRGARDSKKISDPEARRIFSGVNGFILAAIVGLFVMIATVSILSYVHHFIFAFFALAKGFVSYARTEAAAPAAARSAPELREARRPPAAGRPIPPHLKQYVSRE